MLIGKGGQLAVRRFDAYLNRFERLEDTDYYSPDHVQRGLNALIDLDKALSERKIPLCVLLAPRTIDVTAAFMKKASIYGTPEYTELLNAQNDRPEFKINIIPSSKKSGSKSVT